MTEESGGEGMFKRVVRSSRVTTGFGILELFWNYFGLERFWPLSKFWKSMYSYECIFIFNCVVSHFVISISVLHIIDHLCWFRQW